MRDAASFNFVVEQQHVDFSNRATYVAMVGYMLQAAGNDADSWGFGVRHLNDGNSSWVLIRMGIIFHDRPTQNDGVEVRTWVNDINRVMTTRNMVVRDERGKLLAEAVTQWAVIDLEKRSSLDIRKFVDYAQYLREEPSPTDPPKKLGPITAEVSESRKVVYSDIDFNGHANALKYISWSFDMLPIEWMQHRRIDRMDVNFINEARYGQEVSVGMTNEQEGCTCFSIDHHGSGNCLCRLGVSWQK